MTSLLPDPPVRIALLGCGRVARLAHLNALLRLPDARVVAIAEPTPSGREFAARHAPAAGLFDDFRILLRDVEVDAVVVALPTPLHREAAEASFARGAHVYLEKPIAASVDDAQAIIDAWHRTGLVGMIGFNYRCNHLYRELKDSVARGTIGHPVAVRSALTACWPDQASWRVAPSSGGGALLELASHHVDVMRFLFNTEITAVGAMLWSVRGDDEAAMLQLQLQSGVAAQTFVSYGTVEEDRFEVYGTEGKLVVDRYDSLFVDRRPLHAMGGLATALRRMTREMAALRYGLEKRRAPGQEPSFGAALSSFVDAARTGRGARPDLADGFRALRVIDAARRATAERRVVELE